MPRPKQAIPAPYLVKEKSSGLWLVYYTCPVKRYTKKRSTGTRNRGEADLALQAIASELFSIGPKNADYKIAELLAGYVASKEEDLADSDERALKRLTEFFGGFKPEQLVDTAWKRYRKWRMSHDHSHSSSQYYKKPKKVSDATACRELNVMRAAVSWAKRDPRWRGLGHVRVILPDAIHTPRQDHLTREQAKRLVKNCVEPHAALFLLLALGTAARHRAILDLKWSAVTWPNGGGPSGDDGVPA